MQKYTVVALRRSICLKHQITAERGKRGRRRKRNW